MLFITELLGHFHLLAFTFRPPYDFHVLANTKLYPVSARYYRELKFSIGRFRHARPPPKAILFPFSGDVRPCIQEISFGGVVCGENG